MADDGSFEDDDLDELPADALLELEHGAFLSTQAQTKAPLEDHKLSIERQCLEEHRDARVLQRPISSDYRFVQDNVVNLNHEGDLDRVRNGNHQQQEEQLVHDEIPEKEHYRQQKYGGHLPGRDPVVHKPFRLPTKAGFVPSPSQTNGYYSQQTAKGIQENAREVQSEIQNSLLYGKDVDVTVLKARIAELEREQQAWQKSVEDAKSAALSKSGETSILRSNLDKITKEHKREISTMQRLHAEEVAKQKADLELAKKIQESMETSNRFLEHDLAQEAQRARQTDRPLAHRTAYSSRTKALDVTPKREKALPFRDGFNDEEMIVSPSKSKGKRLEGTPKGMKRKRTVFDGPGDSLPMNDPVECTSIEPTVPEQSSPSHVDNDVIRSDQGGRKFAFIQKVLNHRPIDSDERTLEILSTHIFPSNAKRSLAAMVYDGFGRIALADEADDFVVQFCLVLQRIWSDCLENTYYVALYLIVDLLQYILLANKTWITVPLVESLVPVIQKTADLVAIPTVSQATMRSVNRDAPVPDLTKHRQDIDVYTLIDLLHSLNFSCCSKPKNLARFWTAMEFDFVLLMLHDSQPMDEITLMLQLLTTSALESTFGAISALSPEHQMEHENSTVDRLANLLSENPKTVSGTEHEPQACSKEDILQLRLQTLSVFVSLCGTQHGVGLLSNRRNALVRLIDFLHIHVKLLYEYDPETHELKSAIVNTTVQILHRLTLGSSAHETSPNHLQSQPPPSTSMFNLTAALQTSQGGIHKHLVNLARVAFADENGVLESGIEEKTASMAHDMLDAVLSPEEGDALMAIFGVV